MNTFDELMGKVTDLWKTQQEKAKIADSLLEECEVIEGQIIEILEEAKKLFPDEYNVYLNSFKDSPKLDKKIKKGKKHGKSKV